jgi:ABC-type Mn2+/Zn2+ transport system permease subunit
MKKKDLVETAILILGLWFLYRAIISLFVLIYSVFMYNPPEPYLIKNEILSNIIFTFCFSLGVFLCFKKREFLINQLGLLSDSEILPDNSNITKSELLGTAIVILSIGLIFQQAPNFLYSIIEFFKERLGIESTYRNELGLYFIITMLPFIAILLKDKIVSTIYPETKKID